MSVNFLRIAGLMHGQDKLDPESHIEQDFKLTIPYPTPDRVDKTKGEIHFFFRKPKEMSKKESNAFQESLVIFSSWTKAMGFPLIQERID